MYHSSSGQKFFAPNFDTQIRRNFAEMPQQENFAFSTQERTSQTESPTTYCYHKQLQASQRIALFIELRATVWCTRGWWQNWDVVDCVVYCHQYAISFHISIPHTPKMSPTFSHQHFLDAKLFKYFFESLGFCLNQH